MEGELNQRNTIATVRPNSNRVIITIYVESPTKRFPHQTTHPTPTNRIRPKPKSRKPHTTRPHGYDRRAQLLAFVHGLRDAGPEKGQQPRRQSRPGSKMWKRPSATERTPASFLGIFGKTERSWKYERIVSEENSEINGFCVSGNSVKSRNKKHQGNSIFNFCCNKV